MKHTPTPWKLEKTKLGDLIAIRSVTNKYGCCVPPIDGSDDEDRANAEFIVTACNAHEELVTNLKNLILLVRHADKNKVWDNRQDYISQAEEALAKAGVKS